MKIIICFPPYAGGNHLKNLVSLNENNYETLIDLYKEKVNRVHAHKGLNLTKEIFYQNKIVHGHFGEIMSLRQDIEDVDKKWILLSPDTHDCRSILANRFDYHKLDSYFDNEQVFLYEPHMYSKYFGSKAEDIMNISVYELFSTNINNVLDRINFFLSTNIDKDKATYLHSLWKAKN